MSQSLAVRSWTLDHDVIVVHLTDGADLAIICNCRRHHWGVTEVHEPRAAHLNLRCHHCGSRIHFAMEVPKEPA